MNNLIIKRSQIVEAQVKGTPATGRKYPFLEIPNLAKNNIVVYGLACYGSGQLANSPNGFRSIPTAGIPSVVLTMVDDRKREFAYQLPSYDLIRANVGGFITLLAPRKINLTDCYIQLTSTSGGILENDVLCVNLYYDFIENVNPATLYTK